MWSCIANNLQHSENSWSLGSFGAIAEFNSGLTRLTRTATRIAMRQHEHLNTRISSK